MATAISDMFTDTNGVSLDAHTPDVDEVGGGWSLTKLLSTSGAPAADIQSNQLRITTDEGAGVCDAGQADCIITTDWIPAVSVLNRNSIVFRYASVGNTWLFNVREDNGDWRVNTYISDVETVVASGAFAWTEGQTYALKVDLSGNIIKAYIDGDLKSTITNSYNNTQTKHGLVRNTGSNLSRFDNFLVTYIAADEVVPLALLTRSPAFTLNSGRRALTLKSGRRALTLPDR